MLNDAGRSEGRNEARQRDRRGSLALVTGLSLVLLAACTSSATLSPSSAPLAPASAVPSAVPIVAPATASVAPSSAASTTPSELPTAVPTSLDPCQLIPASEASTLAGTTFGPGVEHTTPGGGKICTYGAQTLNVFMVIVGQAPDVQTAQAGKAAAEADIAKVATKGLKFVEVPTLGDGAAYYVGGITFEGHTVNGSAIYGLKGTVFYGFSDLAFGSATPNAATLQTEAQTMLGHLP